MLRKILLPSILVVLAYGFWVSPDFKEIAAGVAIFLFGMLSLEEGFRAFTGGLLESLLRRTTDKLWKSLSFGFVTTSIMQSSSLVSVITISFLSAGLISLAAGIGIIFGANLGTTTGAWLVAGFGLKVKISAYAMPMIVFGVILVFQKSKELKGIGYVLSGLGFLFLGIHHMKEGFDAFSGTLNLARFAVDGYSGVLLFTLLGLIATVVMQSSHATLVLIITALAVQQITYENALALAIGANVGTTVTAILGAMSANVEGRRLAGAHLIFNLVTAALAIALIYQLTHVVDIVSAWLGIAVDNHTLKLAVFHTLFNLMGVVLMTPFIKPMVNFLEVHIKAKSRTVSQPRFLHESDLEFADTTLRAVRKETRHLYDNAFEIIAGGLRLKPELIRSNLPVDELIKTVNWGEPIDIDKLYNQRIKGLYGNIINFISRATAEMTVDQTEKMFDLRLAGRDIVESIKNIKHLQKNLSVYMVSDNLKIRKEYDALRLQLATVLRELTLVQEHRDDSAAILSLDGLKSETDYSEEKINSTVDSLIRKGQVSVEMATSLMNDSSYAYNISNKLIKLGEILFSSGSAGLRDAERSISLEDDEIEAVMKLSQSKGEINDAGSYLSADGNMENQ